MNTSANPVFPHFQVEWSDLFKKYSLNKKICFYLPNVFVFFYALYGRQCGLIILRL